MIPSCPPASASSTRRPITRRRSAPVDSHAPSTPAARLTAVSKAPASARPDRPDRRTGCAPGAPGVPEAAGAAGADTQFTDETSELEVISPSGAAEAGVPEAAEARDAAPVEQSAPRTASPYGPITPAAGGQGEDPSSDLKARES